MVKEFAEKLFTVPVMCSMPPSSGSCELPVPPEFIEDTIVGVMVTLPEPSIATEESMFMSRLRTIGVLATIKFGLKVIVAEIGPGTVF